MKHTTRRAAFAASLLAAGALLAQAQPRHEDATESPLAGTHDDVDPGFARVQLAESLVRSERTAILLGEFLASEAPDSSTTSATGETR